MNTPLLYHFTCEHGHTGIEKIHQLIPNIHPFMRNLGPLIWLTAEAEPTRESVGLTSSWISCDRMAYRYIAQTKAVVQWSAIRGRPPEQVVTTLESFGKPEHWWVARRPLLASEFSFDAMWRKSGVRA